MQRFFIIVTLYCVQCLAHSDFFNSFPYFSDFEEPVFDMEAYRNNLETVRNASLGFPDSRAGEILEKWDPNSGLKAHELGTYYQGDILNIVADFDGRSGIVGENYRWPKKTLYYKISKTFSAADRKRIMAAIDIYRQKTCIKFVEAGPNQKDYVSVENSRAGCFSNVGKIGGAQVLNLQTPGCLISVNTILHEFLHTLGFMHEHQRTDRDRYITIIYANIIPEYKSAFDIAKNTVVFNIPYDYYSVMHYGETAFTKNNKPTIVSKKQGVKFGNSNLSPLDIRKLHAMYKC